MDNNKNNNHWVMQRLADQPAKVAIIWNGQFHTYSDLVLSCHDWLSQLKQLDVKPGDTVAICGNYSPFTCALFLALLMNGNIIVPLASTSESNKNKFLDLALVQFVVQFSDDTTYSVTHTQEIVHHPLYTQLRGQQAAGIILFSSGSTGTSKGIVLNANHLLENYQQVRKSFITLAFLLMDHIGGVNTMLNVLLSGGTLVNAVDKMPRTVCQAIQDYKVELLPTTPTFLNLLIASGMHEEYDLSSLQVVTYGTEPMGANALQHIHRKLPHVRLKQTYGLSEVGILPTKSQANDSLWFQIRDDVPYKIIDGILFLQMKTAMLGYLNAPSPFDAAGWFNTGDSVVTQEVDGQLFMQVLGRKSEIINVGGEKVYPAEVEDILLQHPLVADVMVYAKSNPVMGQIVAAKINLMPEADPKLDAAKLLRQYCVQALESYKIPQIIAVCTQPLYGARFKKNRSMVAANA